MLLVRDERRGFTLIELLIVVAIIAILAAIAVPNFLEAQVRAKITRAKADQRTLATALETYAVDCNTYPPEGVPGVSGDEISVMPPGVVSLVRLTTPIAYVASTGAAECPFEASFYYADYMHFKELRPESNPAFEGIAFRGWGLSCLGPDRADQGILWGPVAAVYYGNLTTDPGSKFGGNRQYDATNGTVSSGDIARFGGAVAGQAIQVLQSN